jgi:hypothetical protein
LDERHLFSGGHPTGEQLSFFHPALGDTQTVLLVSLPLLLVWISISYAAPGRFLATIASAVFVNFALGSILNLRDSRAIISLGL